MLNKQAMENIRTLTQEYWDKRVQEEDFIKLAAAKKEFGHAAANLVDGETTDHLSKSYEVYLQHGKDKTASVRSMGDMWIKDADIFHPINIKTGKINIKTGKASIKTERIKRGRPNMTAMVKLLTALLSDQIDSYYLLIIKFTIPESTPIAPEVYFVDMLDHLKHMAFDAGPGQIMMKEKEFYEALDEAAVQGSIPAPISVEEKIVTLLKMYPDGVARLKQNRDDTLADLKSKNNSYKRLSSHPLNQSQLRLRRKI